MGPLFHLTGNLAELGSVFRAGSALAFTHITADRRLKRPIEVRAHHTPQMRNLLADGATFIGAIKMFIVEERDMPFAHEPAAPAFT